MHVPLFLAATVIKHSLHVSLGSLFILIFITGKQTSYHNLLYVFFVMLFMWQV